MKKIILAAAFLVSIATAQVSKQDVEYALKNWPTSSLKQISLVNVRTFYTDGSNALTQKEYKGEYFNVEVGETSLRLLSYEEPDKAKLAAVRIIPYSQMTQFVYSEGYLTIYFNN